MSSVKKQKQKPNGKLNQEKPKQFTPGENDIIEDDRFRVVHYDPRFAKISKKKLKLKIDSRFKSMMTDSRFGVTTAVDKYGRRLAAPKKNKELEEFYDIDDDEAENGDAIHAEVAEDEINGEELEQDAELDVEEEQSKKKKGKKQKHLSQTRGQKKNNTPKKPSFYDEEGKFQWNEVSSSEDEQNINKQLQQAEESDEYDEDALRELEEGQEEFKWSSDEDDAIPKTEPTSRLALVNYDWMNINSQSIMLTLSSFIPKNGYIKKVSVHPSLFGLERMKQEQALGPDSIWKTNQKKPIAEDQKEETRKLEQSILEAKDEWVVNENKEGDIDPEKLRQYERDRLRYYFAIIECDSVATADKIYEECNKYEFEKTAIKIDLRFVPKGEKITTDPIEVCTEIPAKGKVSNFLNRAIQHTNVKLTWEEPDYKRYEVFTKDLKDDEYDKIDIDEYLGELSESAEENNVSEEEIHDTIISRKEKKNIDLLSNAKTEGSWKDAFDKGKRRQKRDEELIITFNPGFSNSGNSILEKEDTKEDRKKGRFNHLKEKRGKNKEIENDKDFFMEDPTRKEAEEEDEKYKKSHKYKDELSLLVSDKPKNAKEFKPDPEDPRFIEGLYNDSRFGIDQTSKHYVKENSENIMKAQISRKKVKK